MVTGATAAGGLPQAEGNCGASFSLGVEEEDDFEDAGGGPGSSMDADADVAQVFGPRFDGGVNDRRF